MIGKVFHQLTVLHRDGSNQYSEPMYVCRCSCGKLTRTQGNYLRIGKTKSCGCRTTATHGMSKHPLWNVLNGMKQRCRNPKNTHYKWYGEKGINVCEEWCDPSTFFEWAFNAGWEPGLSIDRIDERLSYSPSNCRFITKSENTLRCRCNGKHVGKIFGTWKILSKRDYESKSDVECIHCGSRDFLRRSNVVRVISRQCNCRI